MKKIHVPQGGIEPTFFLVRSGQVWSGQNQMKNVKQAAK